MKPPVHLGLTAIMLAGAKLAGYEADGLVYAFSFAGGVLLDADKIFEIAANRTRPAKKPDITAPNRVLHSILAFPFGLVLSWLAGSWLPFFAVLFHIAADSFIPAIEQNGRHYPSHPPLKWLAIPLIKKSWSIVKIGWPVDYPPKFNWVYTTLGPAVGWGLFIFSVALFLIK